MTRAPKTKQRLAAAIADVSHAIKRALDGECGPHDVATKLRAAQAACGESWIVRDPHTFESLSRLHAGWDKFKLVRSLARKKISGVTESDVASVRGEVEQELRACEFAAQETPLAEEARDALARR